jgi:hypothetical protein
MKTTTTLIAGAVGLLFAAGAFAQAGSATAGTFERNLHQQQRIEQGLQTGALTTREAARLEAEQSRVEYDQARALRDGTISPAERARLSAEQDRLGRGIARQSHDAQRADPNSPSSQRMLAQARDDVRDQRRIVQGVQSGQLTGREAGRLQAREAREDRMQARAGRDGHVGAWEQHRLRQADRHNDRATWRQKHDAQVRGNGQGWHQGSAPRAQQGWNHGASHGSNHASSRQARNHGQGRGPVAHSGYQHREVARPVTGSYGNHAGHSRRRG